MKIVVTFKTADAVDRAVEQALSYEDDIGITDETRDAMEARLHKVCGKFFEYGEYANIEVDTITGAARVLLVRH